MNKLNRVSVISYVLLGAVILFLAVFSYRQYSRAQSVNMILENHYERAFSELTENMEDIRTSLEKSLVVSSPSQMASLSNEIYKQVSAAKSNLAELPINEINLENTSKFLSQAGDFTYVLTQDMISGKKVSDQYYNNLIVLADNSEKITQGLFDTRDRLIKGEFNFTQKEDNNAVYAAGGFSDDFTMLEEQLANYPSLIYDGPFSEHIEGIKPVMCEGKEEIDEESAKKICAAFLKCDTGELTSEGEVLGKIEGYSFLKGNASISISKRGGYVINYLNSREVSEEKTDVYDAIRIGEDFLKQNGFDNMKSSYFEKGNGCVTVNYAYTQNGVICYSDLIKLNIALDNNEILGFEASGYITNHKTRQIPTQIIDEKAVRDRISPREEIRAINKAVIPKDNKTEVFCYEVYTVYRDREYIIYINAENGNEEDVLMIIKNENGTLTM